MRSVLVLVCTEMDFDGKARLPVAVTLNAALNYIYELVN